MKCKICENGDVTFFKQIVREQNQNLYRCNTCHVGFIDPYISPNESYYKEDYYFYKCSDEYAYLNSLKQVDFHIYPYVNFYREDQKFLEIGCGRGYTQDILRHKYLDLNIYGTETSEYAANFAQDKFGINVSVGAIERLHFEENFFDVIYNGGVLEHVEDPYSLLRKAYLILKTNGTLITSVPNFGSIYRIFNSNWKNYNIFHTFYYTVKSIRIMFEKIGFKIKYIDIQGLNFFSRFGLFRLNLIKFVDQAKKIHLSEKFKEKIYQSDYDYLDPYLKKHIGLYDENLEKSVFILFLNRYLNKLLKTKGIGDSLVIIANK